MVAKPFLICASLIICGMTSSYADESIKNVSATSEQQWQALNEEQRNELIKRYQDLHQLPEQERADLQQRMDWFSQLPKEKQQHMRIAWQNMSASQRDYWKRKLQRASPDQREVLREKILAKYN